MRYRQLIQGILLAFVLNATTGNGIRAQNHLAVPGFAPEKASSAKKLGEAQASLRAIVVSGRLEDLRWPNFSDYRIHVDNFYRPAGYENAWLSHGEPTPQATEIIQVLKQADREGLYGEDYDASRWADRVARLRMPHTPAD